VKYHERPVLGYILVGTNTESEMYVKLKKKACDQLGIGYEGFHLKDDVTQTEINECVKKMS
jgi:5,10-methylene-tetrahydrofolate dehydrogenase/methenyl tetrahydrofolate cyclohydrolase